MDTASLFMQKVYTVRKDKRNTIPAVVHKDRPRGSRRLLKNKPRYWKLIDEFRKITGVPVILNTSLMTMMSLLSVRQKKQYAVFSDRNTRALYRRLSDFERAALTREKW